MGGSLEDLTGKQLGQYRIVEPLGEGGMAAVFKAYQPSMERYVALKVLPRQYASDPQSGKEFLGRFHQEAKVVAQLQHQNILPVFDFGEEDGYTFLVMPFVETGTLAELLDGQPLALPQILHVVSQLGAALEYAHSRGLVHRDVKPSNVLIDESGNCRLTDFGIAKIVSKSVQFTRTGGLIGTPAYMSPEQGRGEKEIDHRSDIYSLGVMLYEMATGRVPYEAETPIAVVYKHIEDPLPLPRSINNDLPESVQRVILKALAKIPEDRYETAEDLADALRAAIPEPIAPYRLKAGWPAGSMKLTAGSRSENGVKRGENRHTWLIWLIGLLAVAAAAVLLQLGLLGNREIRSAVPTGIGSLVAVTEKAREPTGGVASLSTALTAITISPTNSPPATTTQSRKSTQLPAVSEDTLALIRRTGIVRVGIANENPYAYARPDGTLTGEAIEVARAVFSRLGVLELEGVVMEFDSLIGALQAGRIDAITAGMWITPDRCEQVLFADPEYKAFVEGRGVVYGAAAFRKNDVGLRDAFNAELRDIKGIGQLEHIISQFEGYWHDTTVPEQDLSAEELCEQASD